MNFEKHAKKIEEFLEQELKKNKSIPFIQSNSLVFDNFIIKKNKQEKWSIRRSGGYPVDSFHLKSCALAGAKLYNLNSFKKYSELKILDDVYFKNSTDATIYKQRYKTTKDESLKDLFLARYTESKLKSDYAKTQILTKFKILF